MLTFEYMNVFNLDGAIRGMRNSMESYAKSDSMMHSGQFEIGDADMTLAQSLIRAGSADSKFMRQIIVSTDIIAPIEWWIQFDTYKVGVTRNSCSTMHTLTRHVLTPESCELPCVPPVRQYLDWVNTKIEQYNDEKGRDTDLFETIQKALPRGFRLRSTVTMNYESVRNMVLQRKHHKLTEWHDDFIAWARTLPYAHELIFCEDC